MAEGLPEPTVAPAIHLPGFGVAHPDLVYEDSKVVVEYDGSHHWEDPEQRLCDLRRQRALEAAGYTVIHVTKGESIAYIAAEVRRLLGPSTSGETTVRSLASDRGQDAKLRTVDSWDVQTPPTRPLPPSSVST